MAKTDLTIPSLGNKFLDLRQTLPGDGFNWNWERPLSQVEYLAIHQSSTDKNYTPAQIADDHINKNGWGGIGYHFVIAQDGTTFYVGDISTARANVANLNEAVIGICLIGNFDREDPSKEQLSSAHKLCEFFIYYPNLSNITSWEKIRGHKELPNQTTDCPGTNWSSFRIQIVEGVGDEEEKSLPQVDTVNQNSQINNLQTSLAVVNQRVIFLQEALAQREEEIKNLKTRVDQTLTIPQALVKLYTVLLPPGKES